MVQVKFLGKPEIAIDGIPLHIPQKKLLAFLLYILFNMNCTRDELAAVFWCDFSEEDGKRNLRNSLYKVKQLLGDELFITAGNLYVKINPAVNISKDIDIFVAEKSEDKLFALESFVFLDKFHIHDGSEFEKWVESIRNVYERLVLEKLVKGLEDSEKVQSAEYMESFSKKILTVDEYHERAYRCLMQVYAEKGMYNEAIHLYTQLAQKLAADLAVEPEPETVALYEKIRQRRHSRQAVAGRGGAYTWQEEWLTLWGEYQQFLSGQPYCHCVASRDMAVGQAGILTHFFAEATGIVKIVVEFSPLQGKIGYFAAEQVCQSLGYPWGEETEQGNRELTYIRRIQAGVRKRTDSGERLLIWLKNLCCADSQSLPILLTALLSKEKNLFVLGDYCCNLKNSLGLRHGLSLIPHVKIIHLPVLQEEEATLLNGTGKKQMEIFLADLDEEEFLYLNLLAVFDHGVEPDLLARMANRDLLSAAPLISRLRNRHVVEEITVAHRALIRLTSAALGKFLQERNGQISLLIYHQAVTQLYEEKHRHNEKDYFYISQLVHHFQFTDREYEKLYYSLLQLEYTLNYYDEFFPTLEKADAFPAKFYLNRDLLYEEFDKFGAMIRKLGDQVSADKGNELKMRFDFLLGRTLNRDGRREEGIAYIRELIAFAEKLGRNDFLLKGCLETIYYGIKCSDTGVMEEYIQRAYQIDRAGFDVENGILYRLHGLYHIMLCNYDQAEEMLRRSIDIFENPKRKNANYINVAAAYDYLGILFRGKGEYGAAEKYLKQAIDICLEKGNQKSLDIFYADLGYTYFLQGEYGQALRYCEKSLEIYNLFGTYWLRSIGESCLSMIYLYNGRPDKAMEHFRRAEIFSRKEHTPEEMLLLERARDELRKGKILSG